MDYVLLAEAIGLVVICSIIIMYACNSFEAASEHLGRKVYKMPSGVRGATIEAIGSSLPELFTTAFLLFMFNDLDGYAAGIATCAGSAVFNAVIIPSLCIIAVCTRGVTIKGVVTKIKTINLERRVTLRDGAFFIGAEILLIYFLGGSTLFWWMGGALMGFYLIYFGYLMWETYVHRAGLQTEEEDDDDDGEVEEKKQRPMIIKILTLDFNGIYFGGREFTHGSAWVVLLSATGFIALASYFLSEAVMASAKAMDVPPYFTAVILAAAATSVPDTVLSVKNALKGDYDDAVSNAVGSNIFDICVALGLPLFLYGLINGNVVLNSSGDSSAEVQELRIVLIIVSVAVVGLFLFGKRAGSAVQIGLRKGYVLMAIYIMWTTFIIGSALDWAWLNSLTAWMH